MSNSIDSAQQAELITLIRQHGLEEVQTEILERAQTCFFLVSDTDDSNRVTVGATRLGGFPDVPAGWQWPDRLEFLGQINLEEATLKDCNGLPPKQGLLSFFFASESWDDSTIGLPNRVFYFDESLGPLKPAVAPRGYLPHNLSAGNERIYTSTFKKLSKAITLPACYTRESFEISKDEFYDTYLRLVNDLSSKSSGMSSHRLLGHHQFMDGNADEEAWEKSNNVSVQLRGRVVTEEEKGLALESFEKNTQQCLDSAAHSTDENTSKTHLRMADYYAKKREDYLAYLANKEAVDQELEEWILLLQVDTDNETGMQFSDAGFAYFMIRKNDLAALRFDRTYASLWSS